MARTKGSKNKPKLLNETEIQVAKKMGKPKVDWETLAKRLQQALASEIKESDDLKKEIDALNAVMKKSAARHAILKVQNRMLEDMLASRIAEDGDGNDSI